MAANGVMERATQDFNYIRLFDGRKLVSWYSGFRTTNYLVEPNFCVALILDPDENPNKWEVPLHAIAYNVLKNLKDPDLFEYLQQIQEGLNEGYLVEGEEGYPGMYQYDETFEEEEVELEASAEVKTESSSGEKEPDYEAEFDELLSLAQDQTEGIAENNSSFSPANSSGETDPFSGGGSGDPFASTGDSSSAFTPRGNAQTSATAPTAANLPDTPEAKQILTNLGNLDNKMPKKPTSDDKTQLFNYMEKKVAFLEEKINVLSQLVNTLQRKELEIREKNELIAKLMALLS